MACETECHSNTFSKNTNARWEIQRRVALLCPYLSSVTVYENMTDSPQPGSQTYYSLSDTICAQCLKKGHSTITSFAVNKKLSLWTAILKKASIIFISPTGAVGDIFGNISVCSTWWHIKAEPTGNNKQPQDCSEQNWQNPLLQYTEFDMAITICISWYASFSAGKNV